MRKSHLFFLSFFVLLAGLLPSAQARLIDYADVNDLPTWSYGSVEDVQESKIMTGFSDGTFRPHKPLSRAEAVIILLRAKGVDLKNVVGASTFPDVPRNSWFSKAVIEATRRGWIKGFPDGTFRPHKSLNNAEWAILVKRAFDLTRTSDLDFQDVPAKAWFSEAVSNLQANELIRRSSRSFGPSDPVTRVEAAWTVAEIMGKPRLMGTSKVNDFNTSGRATGNSRRTAIRPRDFNPNKQGYDIAKKEITLIGGKRESFVELNMQSDWKSAGTIKIQNNLEDRVVYESIQLELRFEANNVGPASNFIMRLNTSEEVYEKKLDRNGEVLFGGLDINILPGKEFTLRASIKSDSTESFYNKSGNGRLVVLDGNGSMISQFKRENSDRSGSFRTAPVRVEERLITNVSFSP